MNRMPKDKQSYLLLKSMALVGALWTAGYCEIPGLTIVNDTVVCPELKNVFPHNDTVYFINENDAEAIPIQSTCLDTLHSLTNDTIFYTAASYSTGIECGLWLPMINESNTGRLSAELSSDCFNPNQSIPSKDTLAFQAERTYSCVGLLNGGTPHSSDYVTDTVLAPIVLRSHDHKDTVFVIFYGEFETDPVTCKLPRSGANNRKKRKGDQSSVNAKGQSINWRFRSERAIGIDITPTKLDFYR